MSSLLNNKAALKAILNLKEELPKLATTDWHILSGCIEISGWHIREDYPKQVNGGNPKRIGIQNKNEEMVLSAKKVPLHSYKYKPEQELY